MKLRGQASTEYIALTAVVLIVAFLAVYVLNGFVASQDLKVNQSRSYWKSTSVLHVDDWNLIAAHSDANGNASAQIEMIVTNPSSENVVLKKVLLLGMNFTRAYSYASNYAGKPEDLAIALGKGESNNIVLIQDSGPAVSDNYQIVLILEYETPTSYIVQNGTIPIIGKIERVDASRAQTVHGSGCSVGQIPCNMTGTKVCCSYGQVCSMGIQCCPAGQVSCGGSCCQGSCSGGLCVPQGYFVCNGAPCQNGKNCCAGVCQADACAYPDHVIWIIVNATSLGIGENANITVVTLNIGTGNATNSSTTRLEVGSDIFSYGIGMIANGTNATNSTTYACNAGGVGTHTINGTADYGNAVYEWIYEGNNINATFSLACNNAKADLRIPDLYANATTLSLGETANITVSTNNTGGAATGGGSNTALSTNGSGSPLAPSGFAISNLPPGGSSLKYSVFTCSISTSGAHNITATADSNAQIDESDETNNANSSLLITCSGPDLAVSSLAANATNVSYGENVTINITTKNIGAASAGASNTSINASGSGNPLNVTILPQIPLLSPGLSVMRQALFVCNSSTLGTHAIAAFADNTTDVAEMSEANNWNSSLNITCNKIKPDLVVFNLSMNDTTLKFNKNATITVVTKNIGGGEAGNISNTSVRIFNSSGAAIFNLTFNISNLAAGANSTNATLFRCNSTRNGSYTIWAYADNSSWINETNELNNAANLTFTCNNQSSLIVKNITLGKTWLERCYQSHAGEMVDCQGPLINLGSGMNTWYSQVTNVTVHMKNNGSTTLPASITKVYHGDTFGLARELAYSQMNFTPPYPPSWMWPYMNPWNISVPSLAPGQEFNATINYTCILPEQTYEHYINATTDPALGMSNKVVVTLNCTIAGDLHINSIYDYNLPFSIYAWPFKSMAGGVSYGTYTFPAGATFTAEPRAYGENVNISGNVRDEREGTDGKFNTSVVAAVDGQCQGQPAPTAYYPAQAYPTGSCWKTCSGPSGFYFGHACNSTYAGCHRLNITVDAYDNAVEGYDHGWNNTEFVEFNCSSTVNRADPIVNSLALSQYSAATGTIISLTAVTKNNGTASTQYNTTTVITSLPTNGWMNSTQFDVAAGMVAGGTMYHYTTFNCTPAGTYAVNITADYDHYEPELNESNNWKAATVQCT